MVSLDKYSRLSLTQLRGLLVLPMGSGQLREWALSRAGTTHQSLSCIFATLV